jgi:beta-N-acetylhexosaminidase
MSVRISPSVLCGQLIVGGFEGDVLSPTFLRAMAAGRRGGAILFKRNLPSVTHAHSLCRELAAAAPSDLPPFIGVDEEGGRVSRLSAPVLRLPPMRTLARGGSEIIEKCGRVLGAQLAAIGFNLDFAPILDVDTNPRNPIIGDRSFGADPESVCMGALAFYQGLSRGVLGCGKHFPGHGDTHVDSHVGLPVIDHDRARLDAIELVPFMAAARSGMDALMTAHVVVPALDPSVPATLSARVCTDLLRGELGYDGVLFSDDLEMKAVADMFPIEELAVRSIAAGCDVLLVCRDEQLQERAHAALVREFEKSPAFQDRCRDALRRGLDARRRRVPTPASEAALDAALSLSRPLEQEIARRCKNGS